MLKLFTVIEKKRKYFIGTLGDDGQACRLLIDPFNGHYKAGDSFGIRAGNVEKKGNTLTVESDFIIKDLEDFRFSEKAFNKINSLQEECLGILSNPKDYLSDSAKRVFTEYHKIEFLHEQGIKEGWIFKDDFNQLKQLYEFHLMLLSPSESESTKFQSLFYNRLDFGVMVFLDTNIGNANSVSYRDQFFHLESVTRMKYEPDPIFDGFSGYLNGKEGFDITVCFLRRSREPIPNSVEIFSITSLIPEANIFLI